MDKHQDNRSELARHPFSRNGGHGYPFVTFFEKDSLSSRIEALLRQDRKTAERMRVSLGSWYVMISGRLSSRDCRIQ